MMGAGDQIIYVLATIPVDQVARTGHVGTWRGGGAAGTDVTYHCAVGGSYHDGMTLGLEFWRTPAAELDLAEAQAVRREILPAIRIAVRAFISGPIEIRLRRPGAVPRRLVSETRFTRVDDDGTPGLVL
jgi:hypothetical protein